MFNITALNLEYLINKYKLVTEGINYIRLSKYPGYSEIKRFTDTITTEFKKKDLKIFYTNINKLTIEINDKLEEINSTAQYSITNNKIEFVSDYEDSIFHELFHMTSTILSQKETRSGFYKSYALVDNRTYIGLGLNEGYTDLLANRYFGSKIFYVSEADIAETVELLIGKEKMEKLYLNADQDGLLNELTKYASPYDVVEFLISLDDACVITSHKKLTTEDKVKINELYSDINKFFKKCVNKYVELNEKKKKLTN